jgi:hypothetical protein
MVSLPGESTARQGLNASSMLPGDDSSPKNDDAAIAGALLDRALDHAFVRLDALVIRNS